MMTLLRNNKILLVVLAAAVASAAFWFGVLAPKRQEATALDGQITAKRGELAQAQQQMASYQKARASYKSVYSRVVRLGKAVPGDDDVRSLMVQLDSVSGKAKVNFAKVDVGGGSTAAPAPTASGTTAPVTMANGLAQAPGLVPIGTTGVSALPFSLNFQGSFFHLSDFFTRLQHFVDVRNDQIKVNGRLLRVESFSILPASAGWPAMAATVGAASYVTSPVTPPAGAPGAPATGTTPSTGTTPASSGGATTPSTTTATVSGVAR
jgi:hypothetical protein